MFKAISVFLTGGLLMFAALPATTNYQLNSYGFGSGGTANSTTGNYALEGISGEISSQPQSTSSYNALPGFIQTQQANVPTVTVTNPSSYYDKLKFVLDQQGNPSDALYALQVCVGTDFTPTSSSPTCSGTTLYVKSDHTLGASLVLADYQDYTTWGGSGGTTIIGLSPSTTYYIHAKATQGKFTESGYGPSGNAATVGQSITFCLYTSSCGSGSSVSFSGLTAGTPANGSSNIGVDFATNADAGGNIYIYSDHGALVSSRAPGSPITSATADLGSGSTSLGFGAQVASASQTSGGPFNKLSPYDLSGNHVGQIAITAATILTSANPIVGGQAAIQLQAKASNTTPAVSDYAETITIIAAASF